MGPEASWFPSGVDNQTQLIYFTKVPEVRVGPKWWPRIQVEKIRTEFSPLSRKFYVSFWSSSQYPTHIQFVLLRPMKTDLLKNTDY